MDVNNSTVSSNIRAVIDLLQQGGISDPVAGQTNEDVDMDSPNISISKHVILIHGDLGTGEHLQSAQLRRSIKSTPWNRLQHVVFIPGLFHLKMVCADALWRCFIYPPTAREDETSLMRDITQIRPKETGIYCTKPGFCRMHQLIGHAGICRRLDCWRIHTANKKGYDSLDTFAASTLHSTTSQQWLRTWCTYMLQHIACKECIERQRRSMTYSSKMHYS